MMHSEILFRPLRIEDIGAVEAFPPEDWHLDFSALLRLHMGRDYFSPFVGETEKGIAAVGHGIRNGDAAWLGNIIVPEEFRGRGHGKAITAHMVDFFRNSGCRTLLLIATRMGEPVYAKLGFEVCAQYRFFIGPGNKVVSIDPSIARLQQEHHPQVMRMDRLATGEDRSEFLMRFLDGGFIFHDSRTMEIEGYYLPNLGAGLIVARSERAGRALLHHKHGQGVAATVIPEGNGPAASLLEELGYEESHRAPRMVLGPEMDWKPEWIWSRGAGYCG